MELLVYFSKKYGQERLLKVGDVELPSSQSCICTQNLGNDELNDKFSGGI